MSASEQEQKEPPASTSGLTPDSAPKPDATKPVPFASVAYTQVVQVGVNMVDLAEDPEPKLEGKS